MQNLKYKFPLFPTEEQKQQLLQIVGSTRYVWNYFLEQEQQQYKQDKTFRFFYQNCKDLTALKKTVPWLNLPPAVSLQQTLRNLEKAMKQSFKNNGGSRKGFPKFKKKRNFQGSFTLVNTSSEYNLGPGWFRCPNIGRIKAKIHRQLPSDFASCQIKQEAGKWFVVFTVKKQQKEKIDKHEVKKIVGIDLNSADHVCSDGCRHTNPKHLRENQTKIKELQRKLSRKTKSSNNSKKIQLKLARQHNTVKNKRLDWMHKMTRTIVNSYDLICIEDLNVKEIQKTYGKIVQDNGFAGIRHMLEYKANLYGKHLVVIDRYFASSQICSKCHEITKHKLSDRVFCCRHCGLKIDRDLNSSINIERAGTARFASGDSHLERQFRLIADLSGVVERGSHVLH